MFYIDPYIYRMAQCGCVALSEPAFWAGFDRSCHLVEWGSIR